MTEEKELESHLHVRKAAGKRRRPQADMAPTLSAGGKLNDIVSETLVTLRPRYFGWYSGLPAPSQKYLYAPGHRLSSLIESVNLYEVGFKWLRQGVRVF